MEGEKEGKGRKKIKEKKGKAEEKLVRASRLSKATEDFSDKSSCSGLSQVTPSANKESHWQLLPPRLMCFSILGIG